MKKKQSKHKHYLGRRGSFPFAVGLTSPDDVEADTRNDRNKDMRKYSDLKDGLIKDFHDHVRRNRQMTERLQ